MIEHVFHLPSRVPSASSVILVLPVLFLKITSTDCRSAFIPVDRRSYSAIESHHIRTSPALASIRAIPSSLLPLTLPQRALARRRLPYSASEYKSKPLLIVTLNILFPCTLTGARYCQIFFLFALSFLRIARFSVLVFLLHLSCMLAVYSYI